MKIRITFSLIIFWLFLSKVKAQTFFQTQSDSLFQTDSIGEIHIDFNEKGWQFLLEDPERQDYAKANLKVYDKTLNDSVGVRFKGSYGTLWSCVDEENNITCKKLSFKVDINYTNKKQRLFGVKKFSLHSMVRDPSKMREKLAYDLYRKEGIPAPRATWVNVFVNGKDYGVYALIEQVDNKFIDYHWPKQDEGILYKEAYPNNLDTGYYEYHQKNHKDSLTGERFLAFANACYSAKERGDLDEFLDMGKWVKYLALESIINNWDGISTFYCSPIGYCFPHNYYWYLLDGGFTPILWDTDLSFATVSFWDDMPLWWEETENCGVIPYPGGAFLRAGQCDGLLNYTKQDYFKDYQDSLRALNSKYFNSGALENEIEKWEAHLILKIQNELYTPKWQNEVSKLRSSLMVMEDQAMAEINGKKWQNLTFDSTSLLRFAKVPQYQLRSLLMQGASENAFFDISQQEKAIRLNFRVDTSNKEVANTWGEITLPFDSLKDLNIYRFLELEIVNSYPGSLWQIAISSKNYTEPDTPEYFAIDLVMEKDKTTYNLPFENFSMKKWAGVNDLDDLTEILKASSGFVLKPIWQGNSDNQVLEIKSIGFK